MSVLPVLLVLRLVTFYIRKVTVFFAKGPWPPISDLSRVRLGAHGPNCLGKQA